MSFKSLLSALGAIVFWSFLAALSVKLKHIPPFFLTGSTLLLGGMLSLPRMRAWNWNKRFIIIGAGAIFIYQILIFISLRTAPPLECNLINYLWPLLIVLLAPVFERQLRLKFIHIIGGLLGFAGAIIAIYNQSSEHSTIFHTGYIMALGAAVTWSCYSLYMKRFTDVSAWTMGLVCIISGLFALGGSVAAGESIILSRADIFYLALLGFGPLGLSFYLWNYAMKTADPQKVGTLAYLTPVLSTGWLALATGRSLDAGLIVALGLVVLGAVLGRR